MFILVDGGLAGLGQAGGTKAYWEAQRNMAELIITEEESRPEENKESKPAVGEDGQAQRTQTSRGPKRDQGRLDEAMQNLTYAESMVSDMRIDQRQAAGKEASTREQNETAVEQNQQNRLA